MGSFMFFSLFNLILFFPPNFQLIKPIHSLNRCLQIGWSQHPTPAAAKNTL